MLHLKLMKTRLFGLFEKCFKMLSILCKRLLRIQSSHPRLVISGSISAGDFKLELPLLLSLDDGFVMVTIIFNHHVSQVNFFPVNSFVERSDIDPRLRAHLQLR